MTVAGATSLLPCSPHTLGKEQETQAGTFQIEWVPAIDEHVLLYRAKDEEAAQ